MKQNQFKNLSIVAGLAATASTLVGLFSALIPSTALAQPSTIREGAWELVDYSTLEQPHAACVASTTVKEDRTYYKIEFTHLKNSSSPTEVFIRQIGNGKGPIKGWSLGVNDSNFSESFVLQSQDFSSGSQIYWGVPINTHNLVTAMSEGRAAIAATIGHGKNKKIKVKFNSDGAAQIFAMMQSQCEVQGQIDNADFESLFLIGSQRWVDPTIVDPTRTALIRDIYLKGGQNYAAQTRNNRAKEALRQKWAPQLNERGSLNNLVIELNQRVIPDLNRQNEENSARRAQAQTDLDSINQLIPGYEDSNRNATTTLESAQQAIAPFKDQHRNLVDNLNEAQGRLNRNQARKTQIDSSIGSLDYQISQLRLERERNLQTAREASNQLLVAQQELSQSQYQYNTFDVRNQMLSRLQTNQRFQWLEREKRESREQAEREGRESEEARRESEHAGEALRQCKSVPAITCPPPPAPPAPGRPPQPAPPICVPRPAPNCAAQEAQLARVNNRLHETRERAIHARERAEHAERESREIREMTETQVNTEYRQLRERVNYLSQRVQGLQNSYDGNSARARQISDIEIPNRQSQLSNLKNEETGVDEAIFTATNDVQSRTIGLKDFETSVDWDLKKSTLDQSQSDYNAKSTQLGNAKDRKSGLESDINQALNLRNQLNQTIVEKKQLLASSQIRIAVLSKELTVFDKDLAELNLKSEALSLEFANIKSRYELSLP